MFELKVRKNETTGLISIVTPPAYFWGILAILLVLVGFAITGIVEMVLQSHQRHVMDTLQTENKLLRKKLDVYSTRIDSIMSTIEQLQRENNKSRPKGSTLLMGTPNVDKDANPDQDFYYDSYLYAQNNYVVKNLQGIADFIPSLKRSLQDTETPVRVAYNQSDIPSIFPAFGRLSDSWGCRFHPIYHELIFHWGIDIANKVGTPVYATADGVVTFNGYDQYYGKMIKIQHGQRFETHYAHLNRGCVLNGDVVHKGQIIAFMGASGLSTGPHLHYEIVANGVKINPGRYLNLLSSEAVAARHTTEESKYQ